VRDRDLPLGQHLIELRRRLTWSALAVAVCTGVSFVFHQQILTLLMEPAQGFAGIPSGKPIYTDLTEFLGIAMKVSLLSGLVVSMPFILFQIGMFVAPGLTPTERRYLYTLLPVSVLAFAVGATFGYRIMFPPAVRFLLSFGNDIADPYIRIGNYVNLMLSLLFWMGIVFETPVVMFFLSRIGVVNHRWLARKRRYAVVVAFVLGAIITPTFDPVNQTMVALPIIVLYEAGIWLARLGGSRRRRVPKELELDARH
jgi:sec-independent protein translocase protein TatC